MILFLLLFSIFSNFNENGEKFEMEGKGLIAQIFQHETDHLDGKLFVDKAQSLRQISEEEIAEIENQKSQTQI
jgi:peptide deformylase